MEIKFLGTGGAFDPEYFNSAALIRLNGQTLLLDCGFTVYPRLVALNVWPQITYILLTHLHNDHSGSLANVLLHQYFYGGGRKLILLYPSESFKNQLHDFLVLQLKNPAKYCEFKSLAEVAGIAALDTFGRHSEGFQTYSYIFEEAGERVVYSGDLQDSEYLFTELAALPALPTTVFHDITFNPDNQGHTYFQKLEAYLNQYKIFGYHCDPRQNPPENPVPLVYNQPELLY